MRLYRAAAVMMMAAAMLFSSAGAAFAEPILRNDTMTPLLKNGVPFDLTAEAGQRLYGYDTLQGACANGGYAYYALFNRDVDKCKIVKVRLDGMSVVKVSAPLKIYHANCLTYNTRKKTIVATCCQVKDKRVVYIDPVRLTVTGKTDIALKASKKIPKSVVRKYKGFTAVAYNAANDCYVGRLRGNNNVIILDGSMRPLRYVKLKGKDTKLLNQSIETDGNYIYDVRSFKGRRKYNQVTIHTLGGAYVGKMRFAYGNAPGNELECIFHDGGRWYAGFYYTTSQKHDDKKHKAKRNNRLYEINRPSARH